MSLDSEVIKAIEDAVKEEKQPDSVAKRLIAWIEAISNSELSNTDNSNHCLVTPITVIIWIQFTT